MKDFANAFSNLSDAQKPVPEEAFEFGAEDMVREAYDFGIFAGLISPEVSFESFIRDGDVVADAGIEDLYDKEVEAVGEDGYLLSLLRDTFLYLAKENDCAVSIRTKYDKDGVLEELATLEPLISKVDPNELNLFEGGLIICEVVDEINNYLSGKNSSKKFIVDMSDEDGIEYTVCI